MSRKGESNWVRSFEVTNPTRHKKFTVYKVTSKVFPKSCPEGLTVISVWKRYNDFKKLYKELAVLHKDLHLTGEFPRFPKAKVFGRFDFEIVEERRKAAWALLDFAANHSQLFTHKVFVQFFEHGYKVKDPGSTQNVDRIDGSFSGSCLIPEKVWSENSHVGTNDDDELSISSLESSSAGTTTFTTDSDSVVSNSVLSDTINLMHPSFTLDLGSLPLVAGSNSSSKTSFGRYDTDSGLHAESTPGPRVEESDSLMGDSYTEAETRSQSSFSVVSSSKSCPSLDNLSSTSTCSSSVQQQQAQQKANALHNSLKQRSWGLSMKRKSNGLSGFFDFLPIFPKKAEEKKISDEKLLADSLATSYICEAAGHFAVAQQHESNSELSKALDAYKEGISILLHGGQSDKDVKRRIIVRTKVEKYLGKAEALHSSLHADTSSTGHFSVTPSLFSPKKVQVLLPLRGSSLDSSNVKGDNLMKPSPLEDLRSYKVVGVAAAPSVLLVVNVAENGPKCYAVKVLRKSANPLVPANKTIVASQTPFMVKLVKWFNTEHTIIHLLQYAGGGKLEDFVYNYQTKQIAIIPHETSHSDNDVDSTDGKEITDDHSSVDRKNAMTVLAAFAEQLENKRLDLNGNLESNNQGELCESYARLFQESDSEESVCEGKQNDNPSNKDIKCSINMKNGDAEMENNLEVKEQGEGREGKGRRAKSKKESKGNKSEKVEKLAVESSLHGDGVNEALESQADSTITTKVKTTASTVKNMNGPKGSTSSTMFPCGVGETDCTISWSNLDAVDTSDLIESSKVLIQTVSRTLTQCDTLVTPCVVVDGVDGRGNHGLESKELNRGRKKKRNKKNGRFTPPGASSSRDYNNSMDSVNGSDGDSVSNQTMSFLESLSSSSGEQKPIGTNETENSNNKGSSPNRKGSLNREQNVDEGDSQCLDMDLTGVNQKPTLLSQTTRDREEDKGCDRTDCYSSNDNSKTSKDELLVADETKLGAGELSTMVSPYDQSSRNGSNENLYEPLPIQRMVPECCVKVWIAEIVLSLEKLHTAGLTYGDLGMKNILLGENGHILLSFTSQWTDVDHVPVQSEWMAPEARNTFEKLHFSVDFWSLGAILFYLLTGRTVESFHPEGFHANTSLKILDTNLCGEYISSHAKSLMTELLQMNPNLRLGYYGAEEIKTHPFFDGFDWDKALEEALAS